MFLPVIIPLASKTETPEGGPPIYFIRETYLRKLSRYKLTPLLVPPTVTEKQSEELYALSGGVLFTGGGDFDAKHYGGKNHPSNAGFDPARDEFELYLLNKTLRDRKPFLGICRGAQALAIASGGILHQNIEPADCDGETHEAATYRNALLNSNTAYIKSGSHAEKILNAKSVNIVCAHHQAIFLSGKNMQASATTRGGIVEIIEHSDPGYFCFGIQSHPELPPKSPLEPFFRDFAKAVRKYSAKKI